MYMLLLLLLFLLPIAGYTWLGVERQEVIEKEIQTINSKTVNPEHSGSKVISRGSTFNQVIALLGKSEIGYVPNDEKLLVYPAAYEVRSGSTVCLALIPIPMRTSKKGE